jgi:hypothetical protein
MRLPVFRIGSKFRCILSTPTAMQSISENDLECLASTGVYTPSIAPNRRRVAFVRGRRSGFGTYTRGANGLGREGVIPNINRGEARMPIEAGDGPLRESFNIRSCR